MAIDYTRVLTAFGITPVVLGRGAASAQRFHDATGIRPTTGHLTDQLATLGPALPQTAIVAVNAHQLAEVGITLVGSGVRRLLMEKPAALDLTEARDLLATVQAQGAEVYVAYNRRFMASILAAQEIVAADGGAISVKFDFSEPARRIATLNKPERELKTWFYGNSTHVLDLAFHLAGAPGRLSGDVSGGSVIDPETGIFAGHGVAARGCHVTWHANWVAPGRWGVEVLTREHRLILQPLEKLRKQTHAGFAEIEHPIDDADDLAFKPGLLKQTRAFLTGDEATRLLPLAEHVGLMQAYEAIRTGTGWQA
jgi:predicted dehydrogenase